MTNINLKFFTTGIVVLTPTILTIPSINDPILDGMFNRKAFENLRNTYPVNTDRLLGLVKKLRNLPIKEERQIVKAVAKVTPITSTTPIVQPEVKKVPPKPVPKITRQTPTRPPVTFVSPDTRGSRIRFGALGYGGNTNRGSIRR